MQFSQFNALIEEGYNHIPLFREVVVDTDTPLALYLKLANTPFTYFLESVQGGENGVVIHLLVSLLTLLLKSMNMRF